MMTSPLGAKVGTAAAKLKVRTAPVLGRPPRLLMSPQISQGRSPSRAGGLIASERLTNRVVPPLHRVVPDSLH